MPSDGSPPAPRPTPGADGATPPAWASSSRPFDPLTDGHLDGHADDPVAAQLRAVDEISRLEDSLATADKNLTDLRAALHSNRRIGMAIGILMALRKVSEEDAFALLRHASSVRNEKLWLVAEDVIRTGTVD